MEIIIALYSGILTIACGMAIDQVSRDVVGETVWFGWGMIVIGVIGFVTVSLLKIAKLF